MTTTATLPQATRDAGFYLPTDLTGGPIFAFGGNVGTVDFSKMSPTTAANMVAHGITCIAKREAATARTTTDEAPDNTELGEADETAPRPRKK